MARFMAALALAYMFDGRYSKLHIHIQYTFISIMPKDLLLILSYLHRMDEYAMIGSSSAESTSKSVSLPGARIKALKHIESFITTFMEPQVFAAAALSSAPSMLAQVSEKIRIPEVGHLRCSGSEIGRFVTMLRNPSPILKACAAFALVQVTTYIYISFKTSCSFEY